MVSVPFTLLIIVPVPCMFTVLLLFTVISAVLVIVYVCKSIVTFFPIEPFDLSIVFCNNFIVWPPSAANTASAKVE